MKQSVSESSDNLALNGDSDSVINMRVTRSSAQELRTQFSEISISSVDSVNDMKLAESINNFSRCIYGVSTMQLFMDMHTWVAIVMD